MTIYEQEKETINKSHIEMEFSFLNQNATKPPPLYTFVIFDTF